MTEPTVKPSIIALVICDDIYQEPSTGKTALVGLFSNLQTFGKCPIIHPKMAVFVSVTGLRPSSSAKLEIIHAENDTPVVVAEGKFPDTVDPLAIADMCFVLVNVAFPIPGTYYVRFWSNTHLLVMRPFEVIEMQPPTGEEQK